MISPPQPLALCLYCALPLVLVRHTFPGERAAYTEVEHCRPTLTGHEPVVCMTELGAEPW